MQEKRTTTKTGSLAKSGYVRRVNMCEEWKEPRTSIVPVYVEYVLTIYSAEKCKNYGCVYMLVRSG